MAHWKGLFSLCFMCLVAGVASKDSKDLDPHSNMNVCSAKINYTYIDRGTQNKHVEKALSARFAHDSPLDTITGQVIHIQNEEGLNHGCTPVVNAPLSGTWIALVQRGECSFGVKIFSAVFLSNASAIVIYNHQYEETLVTMQHGFDGVVSVFMSKENGDHIAELVDNGFILKMTISLDQIIVYEIKPSFKPSPWLYVLAACMTALLIGLVALFVCGMRRSRYPQKRNRREMFPLSGRERQLTERSKSLLDSTESQDCA